MSAKASGGDPRSEETRKRDAIDRGVYTSTPLGKAVFMLLHGLDPFISYSILAHGVGASLFSRMGLRAIPPGPPAHTGIVLIDSLGLSPYRLVLIAMSAGIALKRNIWITTMSRDPMPVGTAAFVAGYASICTVINSYVFIFSKSSAAAEAESLSPYLVAGSAMYVTGLLVEFVSEMQRQNFKSDPKNQGKPYTGGLFRFARHINYGGYLVYRTGYALVAGGLPLAIFFGGFGTFDMITRAVPVLNEYCEKRYGAVWEKFKQTTPYRLFPYIY